MGRILVVDCDRASCHVVAADLTRQGLDVQSATVWRPDQELSGATAEALGKTFREFLKNNGLAAAPVLACVSRDRVVLKDISFPAVAANEEPALVRFQATRDLADAPEEVVLDYATLTEPTAAGERRALAVILRRDFLNALQQLCRSAGLKLAGVVPRPFGSAGCLELARVRLTNPGAAANGTAALLLIGQRWAELNLVQGGKLFFSRSMGVSAGLPAEVRRCFTLLANQGNGPPRPEALYVIGAEGSAAPLESFRTGVGLPVHELAFLTEKERSQVPAEYRSALAGSLGLLQAWSQGQVPVNLASPREPVAAVDEGRRRRVLAACVGGFLLLALAVYSQIVLAGQRSEINRIIEDTAEKENLLKARAQEIADLNAMIEWDKSAVPWIDELYDLAARFPQETGFRLTKIHVEPIARRDDKKPFTLRMTLHGNVPWGKEDLVKKLIDSMKDAHMQASYERIKTLPTQTFTIRVDLARQAPAEYRTYLYPPPVFDASAASFGPPARSPGKYGKSPSPAKSGPPNPTAGKGTPPPDPGKAPPARPKFERKR